MLLSKYLENPTGFLVNYISETRGIAPPEKRPFAVPKRWLQMELKSRDFWQGGRKTSWPYFSHFGFLI